MIDAYFWTTLAGATLGTVGVSLILHVRPRLLPAATVGGILSWVIYLCVFYVTEDNVFLASLGASFAACIWAEMMARACRAPANIFLAPGLIPLLPGAGLYRTMLALISGDAENLSLHGQSTLLGIAGISVGIVAASFFFVYLVGIVRAEKEHRARHRHGAEP